MTPLLGKVALVTGSTRRNGKAIAKQLAEAGAAVMITGHSSIEAAREVAREIENDHGPGRSAACLADVRDPEAVALLVETTIAQFHHLDILINNAGVRRDGTLETTTLEAWHFILQTVLDGAFLCAQAAAPHLAQSGAGRIINIGGISAHIGGRHHTAQTTAKAGIVGLTKALAAELGPKGITVNCVAPGPIVSPEDPRERVERLREYLAEGQLPLERMGTSYELAAAIVTLCGDEWRFMTGQTIHVNGGAYFGGA
jgi:3-oxoacyl-[acyl-carrier protein] reductase